MTDEETHLFNDVTALGERVWKTSLGMSGLNTDPKMFSVMLFKRLWSNHRGFVVLWKNRLRLESDIVLRSGIEAAICIAANHRLRQAFVPMMMADAAFTLQGQIRMYREGGDTDMVRKAEATLRDLLKRLPPGSRAAKLDWKDLADRGGTPQLYDFHRMLSGLSSHVTGLSVLNGVTGEGLADLHDELSKLTKRLHPMLMAGATLQGSLIHAAMIDDMTNAEEALALVNRMGSISEELPGVAN